MAASLLSRLGRRVRLAVFFALLAFALLFIFMPVASTTAAPSAAPAVESRDTILATAEQTVYGQWVSPVTVTIDQLTWPIRWGTFIAGRMYTGMAYTQQNPQEDWPTFSANMRNHVGTPGVDLGSDCSGFASIVWQVPRQNTWTFLGSGYVYRIQGIDELAPGDGLLIEQQHVAIYKERLESGLVVVLEETDPQAQRSEWSWAYADTYIPIRRVNVTDNYATPVTPARLAPANNAATSNASVAFQWRPSTTTGVDGYRLRVATSAAAVETGPWVLNETYPATTTSVTRTLATRGDLYWDVQACKGCGGASPTYSTGTNPWELIVNPPSGAWQATYYNGTSFNSVCGSGSVAGSQLFKDWQTGGPSGCPVDNFSARFTQSVTFPGGHYTFALGADDWARLKLDGTTILDNGYQWPTTQQVEKDVTAGTHTITVEYVELGGFAKLSAWWWGPGFDLPHEAQDPNQWYAEYFGNKDLDWSPVVSTNEGAGFVHHEWGTGSPGWGLPADQFSARYQRTVYFPCGLYNFKLEQNNGAIAYLDGSPIPNLSHWSDVDTRYTSLIRVPAGNHSLRVDYYENTGPADVGFSWSLCLACPGSPSPSSGQNLVAPDSVLKWTGDPNNIYPVKYTVYLNRATGGWINPTTAICSGTSATFCDPPGGLALNAHYYWKVKADDGTGDVVESPVWDFWTVGCPVGQFQAQYFRGTSLAGSAVASACEGAPLSHDWGYGGPSGLTDNFSARWSGLFDFIGGPYTFTVTADDGMRLWVDGELLIDQWKDQPATTYSATKVLPAGRHAVRVEYYEHLGAAVAKVGWQVAGCSTGQFRVQYFGNTGLSGTPAASGCEASPIDHDWGAGSPAAGVGADNFSARWAGSFDFAAGEYAFVATADDGVRLWIDGEQVVDGWIDQAPTTYQVTRTLSAGPHTVQMDYYEHLGGAVAKLDWHLVQACGSGQFQALYFANMTLAGAPAVTACEDSIAHDWGTGGPAGVGSDYFSARWTGTFDFGEGGPYTFVATSDDGMRVYVDGALVIDEWKDQAPTTYQATRVLAAGTHVVKVEYYEKTGGAVARVSWVDDCPTGQFLAQYFGNKALSGAPSVMRCEASPINYDWGNGGPGGVGVDNFSVRWQGTFDFAEGNYTFWARADDGIRIYVDDVLVYDHWIDTPATLGEVTHLMTAGPHSVRVEYYENTGLAVAQVGWNPQ